MTVQQQLDEMIEEHGYQAVKEAFMFALRRTALAAAAKKFGLIPHTVGHIKTKEAKGQ